MEQFGTTPLLITTIVLQLLSCCILRSHFCKHNIESNADLHAFNALSSLFSMGVLAITGFLTDGLPLPSLYTVLLGLVFGVATALCAVMNMKALEIGPLSYTTVICSCAMLIPALSGRIFWAEPISLSQIFGVAFMLVSFFCSVDRKNDRAGASFRWLFFCLGTFAFSGAVGVMQKVHQSSPHQSELSSFLVIAFAVSTIFSLVMSLALHKKKKQPLTVLHANKRGRFWIVSIVCGIGIALTNQINMYLAGAMPSILFVPIFKGVVMLLSILSGVVLFRERLSAKQWTGLAVGVVATLLLCGVF